MRKDYIADNTQEQSEPVFVERFWTENWKRTGGVEGHVARYMGGIDRFALKSEWRIMRRFLDGMPPDNQKLLDAGCGTGEWTRRLGREGYSVTGLDISRETIEELKRLFPEDDFVVGDIRDTGLPDNTFGGIFSWGTFEHFEEGLQPCVRESYRLLVPGGFLFLTVPLDHFGLAIQSAFEGTNARPIPENLRFYQWRLTRQELSAELARGGFEVVLRRPIHRRQGVVRFLHRYLGMNYSGVPARAAALVLGAMSPPWFCAHMVMAVARKPARQS